MDGSDNTLVELKVAKIETKIKSGSDLELVPQPEPVEEAVIAEECPAADVTQSTTDQATDPTLSDKVQPPVEVLTEAAEESQPCQAGDKLQEVLPTLGDVALPEQPAPEVEAELAAPAEVGNGKATEIQQENIKNALKEIINEIEKVVGTEVEFGIVPTAAPPPAVIDIDNKENVPATSFELPNEPEFLANENATHGTTDEVITENYLQQPAELLNTESFIQVRAHIIKLLQSLCWWQTIFYVASCMFSYNNTLITLKV